MIQKTLVISVLVWATIIPSQAQQLEVVIANVKNDQGQVRVALFSEENYLKKSIVTQLVKAKAGELKVLFDSVPPGTYAINIIHDANENGELDRSFIGIPKEGYAFSNNTGKLGSPDFNEASFKVGEKNEPVKLTLIYY